MQLRRATALLASLAIVVVTGEVRADAGGEVDVAGTFYHEGFGGPLEMNVVTPSVTGRVEPIDELAFRLGWQADVVSGASVAVVDAPSPQPDVVSTATQLTDFRNTFSGGAEMRSDFGSIRAAYSYGFENDYRSHGLQLGARAEAFERTMLFDLSYARGWDSVCDTTQGRIQDPVQRRRLASSQHCFQTGMDTVSHDLSIQTFQGSWTQLWAPIFSTQLTLSAQLVDGFQSNPYRGVWLGRSAAQEHHPDHRARYAAALGLRLWLEPLSGAVQATARVYRDTWDVNSVSAELAYEEVIEGVLRIRVHGRYYTQTHAAFYSDDYALRPRGQYFTGDRELSAMSSVMVGGSISFQATNLGDPLSELDVSLRIDWLHGEYPDYHYGLAAVPNRDSLIGSLALELHF
ncbi:MAG: DUF3570 domain-containing protein [Sandaracinus sp.]